MFLKRAMRYYRVWIYCCNVSLLLATLTFVILLIWFLTDDHMNLFPSVSLYHPSFLYGFLALILQGGVVQAIGCLGALRMNEKLLSLYWNILVILIFGDAIVGVIWLFRYNVLVTNLRSDLKERLNTQYGLDASFQEVWDRIQVDYECCGVDGPFDYNSTSWLQRRHLHFPNYNQVVPRSCCRKEALHPFPSSTHQLSSMSVTSPTSHSSSSSLHQHHRHRTTTPSQSSSQSDLRNHQRPDNSNNKEISQASNNALCIESYSPESIYVFGCYDSVLSWLRRTMDALSVLGFCVISFLKVCFAFILRYELKEMIHKIQVLKGNNNNPQQSAGGQPLHELEAYLPRASVPHDLSTTFSGTGTAVEGGAATARRRLTRASHGMIDESLFYKSNPATDAVITTNKAQQTAITTTTSASTSTNTTTSTTAGNKESYIPSSSSGVDKKEKATSLPPSSQKETTVANSTTVTTSTRPQTQGKTITMTSANMTTTGSSKGKQTEMSSMV